LIQLEKQIQEAETMTLLEDIYLPFKPKRKTKASVAREKGLQKFADFIMNQHSSDINAEALKYINPEKGVLSIEDAFSGARDILAEFMSEQAELRGKMRELFLQMGTFHSKVIKGKETTGQKYTDYFDWSEAVKTAPSHRILALRRAEKEIILSLDIEVPEELALQLLESFFVKSTNAASVQVRQAAADAFKLIQRLFVFLQTMHVNYYWLHRLDRNVLWPSTLVFVPAVNWLFLMSRVN